MKKADLFDCFIFSNNEDRSAIRPTKRRIEHRNRFQLFIKERTYNSYNFDIGLYSSFLLKITLLLSIFNIQNHLVLAVIDQNAKTVLRAQILLANKQFANQGYNDVRKNGFDYSNSQKYIPIHEHGFVSLKFKNR